MTIESILVLRVLAALAVPTNEILPVLAVPAVRTEPRNTRSTVRMQRNEPRDTSSPAVSAVQNLEMQRVHKVPGAFPLENTSLADTGNICAALHSNSVCSWYQVCTTDTTRIGMMLLLLQLLYCCRYMVLPHTHSAQTSARDTIKTSKPTKPRTLAALGDGHIERSPFQSVHSRTYFGGLGSTSQVAGIPPPLAQCGLKKIIAETSNNGRHH